MFLIRKRVEYTPEPYNYRYGYWSTDEPWRATASASGAYWVPMETMEAIAEPERTLRILRTEQDYLKTLEMDIRDNGLKDVLSLVYDDRGRIRMKNGHHRTIVTKNLDYERLPVVLIPSPKGIKAWSVSIYDVLPRLMHAAL